MHEGAHEAHLCHARGSRIEEGAEGQPVPALPALENLGREEGARPNLFRHHHRHRMDAQRGGYQLY